MEESQSAYREELQQLTKLAVEIERQHRTLDEKGNYFGDDFTEQVLDTLRESSKEQLSIARKEPYFGRLDFQEEGKTKSKPLYIGKAGISDSDSGDILIVDWRAPVASMFYAFSGGEEDIYYDSPDGIIEGELHLKRNIVIRNQELQRVVDAYKKGDKNAAISDEFLLYRLGENKDNRLRDIVSTIQSEQNLIIRAPKDKALIIQGVAGSGKTTVALHRLAYLIYQYRDRLKAEKMIIFAPNSMFLDYISNVLPELGVGGIEQTTFSEWALSVLDEDLKIVNDQVSQDWFTIDEPSLAVDQAPGRVKGSVNFKTWLSTCMETYLQNVIPTSDFEAADGLKLQADTIHNWFHQEYKHYPPAIRRVRVTNRIKRWIEIQQKDISDPKRQKDFKKKANQRLRTYLKKWPNYTPLTFYKMLLTESSYLDHRPEALTPSLIKTSLCNLKNNTITQNDLAPLVHIHNFFNGIEGKFHHVVIDEAQDTSPFQIALLKDMTLSHSFTILGDLSQGIHDYKGILRWEEFSQLFERQFEYHQLEKSYRSTMEIIHFANAVLINGYRPVNIAKPVFRSGDEVILIETPKNRHDQAIVTHIKNIRQKQIQSIAVICRNDDQCQLMYTHFKRARIAAHLIQDHQKNYDGGVSILPVHLAKGLEFDAVVLAEVNHINYKQIDRDAKLLYVGCTRALHHLALFYSGTRSPLIEKMDDTLYHLKK